MKIKEGGIEMITCYLIDNSSHSVLKFRSRKKLKEYAKENNLRIKPSPSNDFSSFESYYIESYVHLPTGLRD